MRHHFTPPPPPRLRSTRTFLALFAACAAMVSGCGGGSSTTTDPVSFTTGLDQQFSVFSAGRTERLAVSGSSVITRTGDGWTVTVDGKTVEFDSSELGANPGTPSTYFKELDNEAFWSEESGGFSSTGDKTEEFEYLDVYGFSSYDTVPDADLTRGSRFYVVQGIPTTDLPRNITATYSGRASADEWDTDPAVFLGRSAWYTGSFDMTATFGADESTVTGAFNFTRVGAPGEPATDIPDGDGRIPFSFTATGNQLSVTGARITEGRFAGYEQIGIRGALFGPEADEVGGVFEGANPDAGTVMHGYFAATKD